ncbi:MAG: NnrS family protein [Hyphomicrobiales bacterium]
MIRLQAAVGARRRDRRLENLAVLSRGFRPFFLLGALHAGLLVPAWLAILNTGLALPGALDGLSWHVHEMIYGYLAAVVAGFVLTAVPNWTGRLPVAGRPLLMLVALWAAGRIAVNLPIPVAVAAVVDAGFLLVLAAMLWREIAAGRNWRNLPVCVLVTIFALSNVLFHAGPAVPELAGIGERMALAVMALLIGLIGGRITPSFTRNWMARLNVEPLPAPFGRFDQLTMAASAIALAGWVLQPEAKITGAMLVGSGVMHVIRLLRWHGEKTLREPLVAILHLGYAWLAAALLLMGLAVFFPAAIDSSTALHSLTAGAIGTMTLAVMTRASRGHTGRELTADAATIAIYTLVTAGALFRVCAGLIPGSYDTLLLAGGIAWSAAFLAFVASYGPMLVQSQGR